MHPPENCGEPGSCSNPIAAKKVQTGRKAICNAFDVNSLTVTNIRKAFAEGGLDQALNRKKPDREYEHRLDGNAEAHRIALACSAAPEGYERWSLRLLQERFVRLEIVESVSHETIRSTLKKTNLSLG